MVGVNRAGPFSPWPACNVRPAVQGAEMNTQPDWVPEVVSLTPDGERWPCPYAGSKRMLGRYRCIPPTEALAEGWKEDVVEAHGREGAVAVYHRYSKPVQAIIEEVQIDVPKTVEPVVVENDEIVKEFPKRTQWEIVGLLATIVFTAGAWTGMMLMILSMFSVELGRLGLDHFLGAWIVASVILWIWKEKLFRTARQFRVGDAVTYNDDWLKNNMGLDEKYIQGKTSLMDFGMGEIVGFKIHGHDIRVVVKWFPGKWPLSETEFDVVGPWNLRKLK